MRRRRAATMLALALLALWATGVAGRWAWSRHAADRQARQVAVAVTLGEVRELARRLERPPEEVFRELREAGATAVLAKEQTTRDVEGVAVLTPRDLQVLAAEGGTPPGQADLSGWGTLVIGPPPRLSALRSLLEAKGIPSELLPPSSPGAWGVLALEATPEQLDRAGLGFPVERLHQLEAQGWDLLVQLRDREDESPPVAPLLAPLYGLQRVRAVFFQDPSLPGYPGHLPELAAELRRLGAAAGVIEGYRQEGLDQLVKALGGKAVRLHSIREEELPRYPPEEAVQRYGLAAAERSVRVLLVRVYASRDPQADLARTRETLRRLRERLAAEGLEAGPPSPLAVPSLGRGGLVWLTLGLAGAAAWAGRLARWERAGLGAAAAVGITGLALLAAGRDYLWSKLAVLAAELVFPVLSCSAAFRVAARLGGGLAGGLAGLVAATLLSTVGGLWVLALQAYPQLVLRTDIPPGTKLAALLPPLALAVWVRLSRELPSGLAWRPALERVRAWLRAPLPAGWVAGAALLGLVAAFYLSRTGNQPLIPPLPAERALRAWLDAVLDVRPRFKEFLVGHPALVAVLAAPVPPPWDALLGALAAVGQASVVNTFSHAHTPVAVSLERTAHGLWLGTLVGMGAAMAVRTLTAGRRRRGRPPDGDPGRAVGEGNSGTPSREDQADRG